MGSCVSTPVAVLPAPAGPQPGCSPCRSLGTCPHATSGHGHRAWPRPVFAVSLPSAGMVCSVQAVAAGTAAWPSPFFQRFFPCEGAPGCPEGVGLWGVEPAGNGAAWQQVAVPGRSVPAVPVCHPRCPSSCTRSLAQSQGGGWVIALSLDFWRGREMSPPRANPLHVAVPSRREVPHNKLSSGPWL